MNAATHAQAEMHRRFPLLGGGISAGLPHFGNALHTIADMFSPAHQGFQIWHGPPTPTGITAIDVYRAAKYAQYVRRPRPRRPYRCCLVIREGWTKSSKPCATHSSIPLVKMRAIVQNISPDNLKNDESPRKVDLDHDPYRDVGSPVISIRDDCGSTVDSKSRRRGGKSP